MHSIKERTLTTVTVTTGMIAFGAMQIEMIDSARIEGGEDKFPFTATRKMGESVIDQTVATVRTITMVHVETLVITTDFIATTMAGGLPLIPGIIIVGVDPGTFQAIKTIAIMLIMTIPRTERKAATKKTRNGKRQKNQRNGHHPSKKMGLPTHLIRARPCFTSPFRISFTTQRASCIMGTRNAPISNTTKRQTHLCLCKFKR